LYVAPSAVTCTVARSDAVAVDQADVVDPLTRATRPPVWARSVSPSTASSWSRVQRVVHWNRLDVEQ
jgi:hypothetical protein